MHSELVKNRVFDNETSLVEYLREQDPDSVEFSDEFLVDEAFQVGEVFYNQDGKLELRTRVYEVEGRMIVYYVGDVEAYSRTQIKKELDVTSLSDVDFETEITEITKKEQ